MKLGPGNDGLGLFIKIGAGILFALIFIGAIGLIIG